MFLVENNMDNMGFNTEVNHIKPDSIDETQDVMPKENSTDYDALGLQYELPKLENHDLVIYFFAIHLPYMKILLSYAYNFSNSFISFSV